MLCFNDDGYNLYINYIKIISSLSKLFSESNIPFLHYRLAENLFCKAFNAKNLSRDDSAYDAKIDNIGIGIKTFICTKNCSSQKIAEFDKNSYILTSLKDNDLIIKLSEWRNERIELANRLYRINKSYYHCIARDVSKLMIFNTDYDLIDISRLNIKKKTNKSITFEGSKNEYSFNYAKSTLFRKFIIPPIKHTKVVDIKILENPLDLILKFLNNCEISNNKYKNNDYIILPLYSYNKNVKYVPEKSGLNQWNAGGRKRKYGEVYIPIPAKIKHYNSNFFPKRDTIFTLITPSDKKLKAKICQDNDKALMTNPNTALSDWLLKEVLNLKEYELLSYDKLEKLGIDSVKIEKIDNTTFNINFSKIGSYENFIKNSKL